LSERETEVAPYYGQKQSDARKGHSLETLTQYYQEDIYRPLMSASTAALMIPAHSTEKYLITGPV